MKLGIFDLVGVIMIVLAGSSFLYLLWIKNKTSSTWMLMWFFLCVILSALATIVTNIGTAWDWAFAPSQDALLILGGVFLARFAYLYPQNDRPGEARWVFIFFVLLAAAVLTYAISFAFQYFAYLPGELNENQSFYLITPAAIGLLVIIFFRRSLHCSTQNLHSADLKNPPQKTFCKALLRPGNRSAYALRSYGLSLAVALIPVIVVVVKPFLHGLIASYLFNFGAVIAIAALMLTYFTFAPESVTLSVKLVGISLVSVLLILGLAGVWVYQTNPGIDEHNLVSAFIAVVLVSSVLIILLFPWFYSTVLLDPLDRLLRGVKIANEGNLKVQVEVKVQDEISFLTQSFNRLIKSLDEATGALKNESAILERQVAERTIELRDLNQQLINENIVRKEAQTTLDRQLRYEQALADCSQALLLPVDGEENQHLALNRALEHLLVGVQISRAYVFRNFHDVDLGLCVGMLAEACAQGIQSHINNPVNQKFPWSQLPAEMYSSLSAGNSYGGPVVRVFADTPLLLDAFLHQPQPLRSVLVLPISFTDRWWGFIGFDDCENPRDWDEDEILMLRTAAEIIAGTLQRWEAEKHLRETLENLEQRVYARTFELTQANTELKHEIYQRQRFQAELEDRLAIEKTLANISARLLGPVDPRAAINETLADLGAIMKSNPVILIQPSDRSFNAAPELIEWHTPDAPVLDNFQKNSWKGIYSWFSKLLDSRKSIFIEDLSTHLAIAPLETDLLLESQVQTLLLTPLLQDNQLAGLIACINPGLSATKIQENIQLVEVIVGLLGSLLRRNAVLNTLEEKIAERTRELSAFYDMTMLSSEAQEIVDVIQPALVRVMETSSSEAGMIHLYAPEQHSLRLIAMRGIPTSLSTRCQQVPLDPAMISWMDDTGSANDLESLDLAILPRALKLLGYKASTHITLRARGKKQGLLSCYRRRNIPYDPYLTAFLVAIGDQLGMAIENYRLRLEAEEAATIQERHRLARELHDAVSQSLYSLTLFARSGRDAYESGDQGKLLDSLEQLETNSLAALKEMRLLLYQLRYLALDKGGLMQAIESRFNLVERRSGTQANLTIDDRIKLPEHVEQELFLIITEALNNSLKHANASQVSVSIMPNKDQITVKVWNDGLCFDPAIAGKGMGLQNMRERAAALGGQFSISSAAETGTLAQVVIPRSPLA
jgi:signal transduction histidine kinase/HAMP domain-containing protein